MRVIFNMVCPVMTHIVGFVMENLRCDVFLGMDKHLFTAFRILKAQFIKTIALVGFGLKRGTGFLGR
ncbi:hypothetical protein Xcab_04376 [Xenorhabdus cabanillasii JM26]|nr:hypothetical protein Xcab_04376 [Xenorhabdus cabanillasii JM26]